MRKQKKGGSVNYRSKHNVQNGLSGSETQTSNETKNYYARIVAIANQANLKFDEASPELVKGLVKVVSGIL